MYFKRNSILVLITGFVLFFIGIITPIIALMIYTQLHGYVGIIGGADTPTAYFLTFNLFNGLPAVFILSGGSLLISAVFCLIFSKTVKAYCSIKTSFLSLVLSAIGGLGIVCTIMWYSIVAFGEISKYPIEFTTSKTIGLTCFLLFAILIILYIKKRKKNWSVKGFIIDILTCIVYLPSFFFTFIYLYEVIL